MSPVNGTDIRLFDLGTLNGAMAMDTANLTVDGLGTEGVDWEFYQNAGDATVGITIIPEPATLGLVAVFGCGFVFIRRRML